MSSSSPTQQHHRRLFELMEEQQEPFILDVYLMENGLTCKASTRTTHVCWPSFACMKLQSFNIHGIRKNRGWLLNFILNKLLHGKALQQKGGNGGMFSVVEEVDEEVESSVEERSPLHHIKSINYYHMLVYIFLFKFFELKLLLACVLWNSSQARREYYCKRTSRQGEGCQWSDDLFIREEDEKFFSF